MIDFKDIALAIRKHTDNMTKNAKALYETNIDKDKLATIYNTGHIGPRAEIFRKRPTYSCSACYNFIKKFGGVVAIDGDKVVSVWDAITGDPMYDSIFKSMSEYVKSAKISRFYITGEADQGIKSNIELTEDKKTITWHHLHAVLPDRLLNKTKLSDDSINSSMHGKVESLKRALTDITEDAITTTLGLINGNDIYRGSEFKGLVIAFNKVYKEYIACNNRDIYCWVKSLDLDESVCKIRSSSIGLLLFGLAEGDGLDKSVRLYEKAVAPENYKRPTAIVTEKMLKEAKATIDELGYMPSMYRRHATLDDIKVSNVLFSNRDARKRMKGVVDEIFDGIVTKKAPKISSNTEEIKIEDFISSILPTATSIEAYFESRHMPNLVSLIAPKNPDSPSMFKWDNQFSWIYSGSIADSKMKDNVKAAGGKVDGVLRFSIQWNTNGDNSNDYDAHCIEPNNNRIYYGSKYSSSEGNLDVDIMSPGNKVAVENITWASTKRMLPGRYTFSVNNYNHRGGRSGFTAEIEFGGTIYSFSYQKDIKHKDTIYVANVTYDGKGNFMMESLLPSSATSMDAWGLKTGDFYPVTVCMHSPNYWNEQHGVGNKHYMFMLKGCINDEGPNGFLNEFLKEDLMKHKRVFEALGSKMIAEPVEDQLSGLGFSSTKRDNLILKVSGPSSTRTVKVLF